MPGSKKLTKWQQKHKRLLDAILYNQDFYRELGNIRRDRNSILKTTESAASLDGRLLKLMKKYSVQLECFDILKQFTIAGGDMDYTLIQPLPRFRDTPFAKRNNEIYRMWLNGKRPKQIAAYYEKSGWDLSTQYINMIIKRMRDKDVNRDKSYWPQSNL